MEKLSKKRRTTEVSEPVLPEFSRGNIHKKIQEKYPRLMPDGSYVYWLERDEKKQYILLSAKGELIEKIDIPKDDPDKLLERFGWMKHLCDSGITIEGRESQLDEVSTSKLIEESKQVGTGENLRIGEIIHATKRDPGNQMPVLYLVRWYGENMGTATYLPFEDLTGAGQLIRAYSKEFEDGKHLRHMKIWKHVPISATRNQTAIKPILECSCGNTSNLIESPKVTKKKGRGKKRSFFCGLKNPTWAKKKLTELARKNDTCFFDALDSVYHKLPKIAVAQLSAMTLYPLPKFITKLNTLLMKHETGLKVDFCDEFDVEKPLRDILPCFPGFIFVHYRGVGLAHCGVLFDGQIVDLRRYQRLDSEDYILEPQKVFEEELDHVIANVRFLSLKTLI